MEEYSNSEDSQSESEAQEEYLSNLEAALEQLEEEDIDNLPKRHYFVPGAALVEEDG
jgi:hypothetical protein